MAGKGKESASSWSWLSGSKPTNSGVQQSSFSAQQSSSFSGTQGSSSAASQSGTRGSSSSSRASSFSGTQGSSSAASQSGTSGSSSGGISISGNPYGRPSLSSEEAFFSETHGISFPGLESGYPQGASNYGSRSVQQHSLPDKKSVLKSLSSSTSNPSSSFGNYRSTASAELEIEKAKVTRLKDEVSRLKDRLYTKESEAGQALIKAELISKTLNDEVLRLSGHLKEEKDVVRALRVELETEKHAAHWLKKDTDRALLKKGEELTKQLREAQLDLKSSVQLQRSYDQLKIKNEGLNRSKTMAGVYENYRRWSEDQYCRPLGMKKFDPWELEIAVNSPNKEYIGTTRYGAVYKSKLDLKDVVVEILNNESPQKQQDFSDKVDILKRIRHPNLVSYIGAYETKYAFISEDFPEDTLQDRLVGKSQDAPFSWEERVRISASICSTLLFLHNTKPSPMIHGDLKAQNICFGADKVCRLRVFGMSRSTQHTANNSMALSIQSDICAFGIILLQMVTGQGGKDLVRKVLSMGDANQFQEKGRGWQREVLTKKQILDVRLVDCPIEDAVKMLVLGLRCSKPEENQHPDLATEVWTQIQSMRSWKIPSGLFG